MERRRFDKAGLTPIIGRYVVPRGEPPAANLERGSEMLHSAELCDGARSSPKNLHLTPFEKKWQFFFVN